MKQTEMKDRWMRLLLAAGLTTAVACSTDESKSSSTAKLQDDRADITLDVIKDAVEIHDKGKEAIDAVPDEVWDGVKSAYCTMDPMAKLGKIDGVMVDLSGQLNYTAVGAGAGTTFAMIDTGDGNFQGQGYWHLNGSLGIPQGAPASAGIKVGMIYGCKQNPDNLKGYFLGADLAGFGAHFGAADSWMYGVYKDIEEYVSENGDQDRPKSFKDFLKQYSHAVRDLDHAINFIRYAWPNDYGEAIKLKLPAEVPNLTTKDMFSFKRLQFILLMDYFRHHAKLPSLGEGETDTLTELLETVMSSEQGIAKSAESFIGDLELVEWYAQTGGDSRLADDVAAKLAVAYSKMEAESKRLADLTFPALIYSKSYDLNRRYHDKLEEGFQSFLKHYRNYGISWADQRKNNKRFQEVVKWAKYTLDAIDRKRHAIRGLRLLTGEWAGQLRREGVIHADQTIGGIHKEDTFTGCNTLTMTVLSSNMDPAGLAAMAKGIPAATASTLATIIKAPLRLLSMLNPFGLVANTARGAAGLASMTKLRQTKVEVKRYHKLPLSKTYQQSITGSITKGLRKIFTNLSCETKDVPSLLE